MYLNLAGIEEPGGERETGRGYQSSLIPFALVPPPSGLFYTCHIGYSKQV